MVQSVDGHQYQPVSVYIIPTCTLFPIYYFNNTLLYVECNHLSIIIMYWTLKKSSFFRIHPNLRSTVYCNAITAGGAKEWEFAWSQFKNATIAIEADKLRSALACTKQPWLLNRSAQTPLLILLYSILQHITDSYWPVHKYTLPAALLIPFRYLEYTLDPEMIRKQDATSTIVYIANNVVGQPLAWDFVRARWLYIFTQWVQHFLIDPS